MKPTYLYVKQHTITGMKYFGKTTKKDPIKYKGSGLYWKRHLNIHGNNIKTLWTKLFDDESELVEYATKFSLENHIVESDEWANVKIENGLDGGRESGFVGTKHSEQNRKKFSDNMKAKNPMSDPTIRQRHKEKMNTQEIISKRKKISTGNTYVRGRVWYNNGKETKMFVSPPDDTWVKGRLNPTWNYKRKMHEKHENF